MQCRISPNFDVGYVSYLVSAPAPIADPVRPGGVGAVLVGVVRPIASPSAAVVGPMAAGAARARLGVPRLLLRGAVPHRGSGEEAASLSAAAHSLKHC